jgi:hypothetical protein
MMVYNTLIHWFVDFVIQYSKITIKQHFGNWNCLFVSVSVYQVREGSYLHCWVP